MPRKSDDLSPTEQALAAALARAIVRDLQREPPDNVPNHVHDGEHVVGDDVTPEVTR